MQKLGKVNIGQSVPEILKNDLAAEMHAVPLLNKSVETCRQLGDNGSEHLLKEILVSEEEHVDWLEAQLELNQASRRGALHGPGRLRILESLKLWPTRQTGAGCEVRSCCFVLAKIGWLAN